MQPIEIDAAVAKALGKNVLGTALCLQHQSDYLIPFDGRGGTVERPVYLYGCYCEFREPGDADYFGHVAGCLEVVPEFSTDIKVAWGLVEEMRQRGFVLHPLDESSERVCEHWCARFVTADDPAGMPWEAGWSGYGYTAPLAICRAFLEFWGKKDAAAS
jgi:hypothetical protein